MKTVKELINALQKLDPEMPIGKIGHFGEFYQDVDICVHEAYKYQCYNEKDKPREYLKVVDFYVPDIGEEPN